MTFLSRLSAAWRAFRKDDFPPTLKDSIPDRFLGHGFVPSMADECTAIKAEQDAESRCPHCGFDKGDAERIREHTANCYSNPKNHHPLCAAIYGKDCTCKPIGNCEPVTLKAPGIKRKKLASAPKR